MRKTCPTYTQDLMLTTNCCVVFLQAMGIPGFGRLHDCKTPHCLKTPRVRGRRSDPDHHPLKLCCSGPKRTMTDCLGRPFENLHWVLDTYSFISTCDHNKVCQVIYTRISAILCPNITARYSARISHKHSARISRRYSARKSCRHSARIFC